jgi:GNAT superfamily N-acetyltransferase
MLPRPIRHRRARRSDFDAVRALLAAGGLPDLPAERAGRHRFRTLIADLGADLYVAERDTQVVGVVHVVYTRRLTGAPEAWLALLAVAPEARRRGVGRSLVAFAAARARRRGCSALRCGTAADADAQRAFLIRAGWRACGEQFEFDLADPGTVSARSTVEHE